jgi:hypothetical protein
MEPRNQDQHKIPKVYLKKFGYLNDNNQWKVSVLNKPEDFSREKSIGSFTVEANVFDIDSDDPRIVRMFERLNGDLENQYNSILGDLDGSGSLSDVSYAYLLQLIGNLIVRSDHWKNTISDLLDTDAKETFLNIIIGHHCKSKEEFMTLKSQPFFRLLADGSVPEVINRVLLYFLDHLMVRLWNFEIVIIKAQEGKPWWTSTNPVIVHNRTGKFEILAKESEIYFPLSPQYLAYLHFSGSADKENSLRGLVHNKIHQSDDELNTKLQQIILSNPAEFVICAGRVRIRKKEFIK